ncbi:EAL domain-containing protein [Vibrio astriarenae]|uniref:cyclic-guanylate-specific phosphodiesterase n=1 Tax=Vibrio astriarenae TaxID=1481923 RepID=A0A7Z2T553_9VIBR|nr:GGDEF and EAL domain-containing protein [Vibrio astriarenae]QIA64603.1 EAL domain-containing protein [Vibrio astriarenae]
MSSKKPHQLEATLKQFWDGLDDHAWIKDLNGVYVQCNTAVEKAWSRPLSSIIGKTDYEIFDKDLADKFLVTDNIALSTGKQHIVEECARADENGQEIWLETIKSPVIDDDGQVIGVSGMTRNVTRRKQVENQLALAAKIFHNSNEGMIITDVRGNIMDANPAFSNITGYTLSEVIGRNPRLLQSGMHNVDFYRSMWSTLENDLQWKGEFINRRKDGSLYPQMTTITKVLDNNQQLMNFICVFEDVSVQKAHEEKLEKLAFFDHLTELPNRATLLKTMNEQIIHASNTQQMFATLFLDIDHFKHINDSFGHQSGDQILTELARRLRSQLGRHDHIARIGGDEFVILITDIVSMVEVTAVVERIFSLFNQSFNLIPNESLRISTSIGIAMYPSDGLDAEALLKNADTAMYLAKNNGRNGYAFYTPELTDVALSHVRIQSALHNALEQEQFSLAYQPQFDLANNQLKGFEALLRWTHPELGNVSPAQFIPIAERTGLIQAIGYWVLTSACQQAKRWLDEGHNFGKIAVNVSAVQLRQRDFIDKLTQILLNTGCPASRIEIEITEGFLIDNKDQAIHDLQLLQKLGVSVALDDFGTGYSSLSYLKGLPLNKLKIDRSFINDVPDNNESNSIVNAIIAMAKTLSLEVIAEGIEQAEQMDYLTQSGCHSGQGYFLGKPLTTNDATQVIR